MARSTTPTHISFDSIALYIDPAIEDFCINPRFHSTSVGRNLGLTREFATAIDPMSAYSHSRLPTDLDPIAFQYSPSDLVLQGGMIRLFHLVRVTSLTAGVRS